MSRGGVEAQALQDSVEELLDDSQEITLSESGEDDTENSHIVKARNVKILYNDGAASSGDHLPHHSHYVSTKPCIEYKWEKTFYHGHLAAVHMSGTIFAYVLQTHHSGKVRVTNDETSADGRCLLKEFTSQVVDIDFAHVPDAIYIACMEQNGWCTVFSVNVTPKPMSYELLVKIRVTDEIVAEHPGVPCRAIWCVHVPEPGQKPCFESLQDPSNRLILTSVGQAAVVSIPLIIQSASGPDKSVTLDTAPSKGVATILPGALIWDGKMSPDGVVLCLAREDGNIHFYQCVLAKGEALVEEGANLVYTWQPHDGRPVHSVHFLDDFTPTSQQEQFWMFAVTGSEFGRQFRIWNCQHWYCLQTIDILPSLSRPLEMPKLQVTVDPKGDYLIVGDSLRNLVMFLRVDKDVVKRLAMVTSANEFLVGAPILNLVAVSLKAIRPEPESLLPLDPEENGFEARLLTLHAHLLQHMTVTYVGEQLPNHIPTSNENPAVTRKPKSAYSTQSNESGSSLSNQNINGEAKPKEKKKRHKKSKEIFPSLDDVPTPVVVPVDMNGLHASTSREELKVEEAARPESVSPAFVLQPPSAFDGVTSVRRDSSLLNMAADSRKDSPQNFSPLSRSRESVASSSRKDSATGLEGESKKASSKNALDLLAVSSGAKFQDASSPTDGLQSYIRKRDESVSCFTAPPVEEESRGDTYLSMGKRKGDSTVHGFEQGDLTRASRALSPERLDRWENTLAAVTAALAQQNELVQRLSTAVDGLKTSQQNGTTSRDDQSKKSLDSMVKSLAVPIKEINGLEARLTTTFDNLGRVLEGNITKELKSQLGQNVQKSLKPVGDKLTADVVAKLNGIDGNVRQRLEEVVRNPQFGQLMGQAVVPLFAETAKQALQDVVSNQLIPAFQQIVNQSLVSLNQTFGNGTKDYLTQVNRSLETHFGLVDEAFDERFKVLERQTERASTAAVQAVNKELLSAMQILVEQNLLNLYNQLMANLGGQISQKVTTFVKEELREQQSVMHESMVNILRSGVATPGGQVMAAHQQRSHTLMQDIKTALDKRDFNAAFRSALTATDLGAVLFVCEKANVKEVFARADLLQTPVLFSLIQQLAAEIGHKTELKIEYLEEALLAIQFDELDPGSFKFLRTVLGDVQKSLHKFALANPVHPLSRSIRMVVQHATLQLNQIQALQAVKE